MGEIEENSKTDLMLELGRLDESAEALEEVAEGCDKEAEQIESILVWLGRILK